MNLSPLSRRTSAILTSPAALFTVLLGAIAYHAPADAQDYEIVINGVKRDIVLDTEYSERSADGKTLTFRVTRKELLAYDSSLIRFTYKSSLNVATSEPQPNVKQTLIATLSGTTVVVQEMTDEGAAGNIAQLVDETVQEITRQDVTHPGANVDYRQFKQNLKGGQTLTGVRFFATTQGSTAEYTVCGYSNKGKAILVVTRISDENRLVEGFIIDNLWSSLQLRF